MWAVIFKHISNFECLHFGGQQGIPPFVIYHMPMDKTRFVLGKAERGKNIFFFSNLLLHRTRTDPDLQLTHLPSPAEPKPESVDPAEESTP